MKMLLDYLGPIKADVGLKDGNGKNPLDVALLLNYPKIVQILEQYGAHTSVDVIADMASKAQ